MILAYNQLVEYWREKRIRFEPDISKDQIGLSSIDLRLGYVFTWLKQKSGVVIRPAADGFQPTDLVVTQDLKTMSIGGKAAPLRLKPGDFVLGQTLESVVIPADMAAQIQGKSSLARSGLSIHATAPHIHPGFVGTITLEMHNAGPWELEFEPGRDRVCQMIYLKTTSRVPKKVVDSLATFMGQQAPWPESARQK